MILKTWLVHTVPQKKELLEMLSSKLFHGFLALGSWVYLTEICEKEYL